MADLLLRKLPVDYLNYSRPMTEEEDWTASTLFPFADSSFFLNESVAFNKSQNETESDLDFTLPVWRQVVWSILFGGMVIVATGGNLIVIWIVLAHKRMRTVTNYFLVNLSIADAMVSLLNVTFNYTYMLNNNWPFGRIYCKICQFVAILSISASVFTLMAIAVDRYMAIMNPLRPRMGKRTTLCIAAVIWILSFFISCPMLSVFTTFDMPPSNGAVRVVCYSEWPDGATTLSTHETVYNVVFMFLTYFLPIGLMSYTYARVGSELWGSQSIGECTQRQLENIKSKRRVVKMMMVVVLIFAICWLPYHTYFIVLSYIPDLTNEPYIQELYLGIYWLAMSNSMYNPIIYCWMNSRFRRGFQQFFRWCPFVNLAPETLTRRDVVGKYSCNNFQDHHRITRMTNDMERSFYCSRADSQRAGSVRLPMHHSCLQATPSSATMMTSVTTNASLQRMHSIGTINNPATDSYLGPIPTAATATANNVNANFHLTTSSPITNSNSTTTSTATGISSCSQNPSHNNTDLLITRDELGVSKSTGVSGGGLLSPAMTRKSAMNGSKSTQHLSAASGTSAATSTGLVGNQRQQQPLIRWTTPSSGTSNCGDSSSVAIRRSLS